MKFQTRFLGIVLILTGGILTALAPLADTTSAAILRQLPFSARLKSVSTGATVADGNYSVTFSIYTVDSGGTAVWSETQTVAVTDGIIAVNLGSSTAIPASLTFNDDTYYLGLKVGSDAEATPRKRIGAVPMALNADTVDGAHAGTGADNVLTLDSSGNINIAGNVVTAGTLQGGTATVSTLTTSSGALTIDPAGANVINVAGNILPSTGGTYDLGSSSLHFANAYIDNIVAGTVSTSGTSSTSFTINQNAVADADSSVLFYRGGALTSAQLLWNSTTDLFNLNNGLAVTGVITASSTINGATISGGTVSGGSLSATAVNGLSVSGTAIQGTGSFTMTGGTASGETLTLISTSHGTKGDIQFFSSANNLTSAGALTVASTINGATISGGTISGGSLTSTTVNGLSVSGGTITSPTITGTVSGSGSPTITGFGTINGATLSGGTLSGGTYSNTAATGSGAYSVIAQGGNVALQASTGITLLNTASVDNILRVYGDDGTDYAQLTHDATNAVLSASSGELQLSGAGTNQFILGDVGTAVNLVFEESSTISGQGANTITVGQSGDIFNLNTSGATYNIGTLAATGATLSTSATGTTAFTINGPTSLTANILDLQVNGSSKASINASGDLLAAKGTFTGDLAIDTNTLFVDATNNRVGVIDTTPDYTLEVSQVAGSDATLALSDGDVAHGLTTLAETDTWARLSPLSSTAGGGQLTVISDTNAAALEVRGVIGSTDPTDTTPAIKLIGGKASGTTIGDLAAAETVFQIANNDDTAAFTVLGNAAVGVGDTTPVALFTVGSGDLIQFSSSGDATFAAAVRTTGSPTLLTVTGPAHTTLTASTEATDINLNLARTVQFATGALATQRAIQIKAPTYGFVAASTITDAATVYIDRDPQAGTNATITNAWALWVDAGAVRFDGVVVNTASTLTIADDGAGTSPTGTLTPTTVYVEITCSDANGCLLDISETGAKQGQQLEIVNVSANALTVNDTSGQQETTNPALGQYDTASFRYMSDRWVQYATSNN